SVQLISLYGQFDNSVFVHIYPVTETEKQTEFRLIATKVLVVVTVCLLVGSITQKPDWMMMGIKFVLGVVEVGVLSTVYLKSRIQSKA
ncbi:ABC transporter permease, partial [Paucilactobacillus nenjiangensis]|uniref:ABC transporter permease n=1 Tax=Paucilactobacillus nenjiangensis TaxID=1296540 RepID=UPI003BB6D79D